MNPVKMVCPYCGHEGETTWIDYRPMAAMSNRSCFEDSDGRELQRAGSVTCEVCHEQFMYKLAVEVVCEVAMMPEFYNPMVNLPPRRFGEEL